MYTVKILLFKLEQRNRARYGAAREEVIFMSMPLQVQASFTVAQLSIAGIKPENEDCIGIRLPENNVLSTKGSVAVIADGVSAAEAGKEASEICVKSFIGDYYATPDSWSVKQSAHKVLIALNRWLYSQGQRYHDARKGFVSTFTTVVFKSHSAHIFHVGDTRVYRVRQGEIEQLTRDHASRIDDKNTYLSRAVGLDVNLDIDYRCVDLEVGDIFLLSTDGFHDFLTDSLMVSMILSSSQLDDSVCEALVDKALENGSNDNISVQILRVDTLPNENIDDVYSRLTALPFPPHLDIGFKLDGLFLEKELHVSSRSQVYVVRDSENQRYVMKTPSANFDDDAAYIERFIMESWVGQRINSPHVVKVKEAKNPSCLYYLTEYIQGLTLSQWMRENPRPDIQDVQYYAEHIVKGIRAFHRRETLHQDLKPDNIMIDGFNVISIIDFGSCYISGIAEIDAPFERDVILGTASYSAPEHILMIKPTVAADQFSIAVILYEMLTGKQPYGERYENCLQEKDFEKLSYISALEYNDLVPRWLDGALQKALSINPANRYGDVSEFLHDVQHPNYALVKQKEQGFISRSPIRFWQTIAAIELLIILLLCSVFL